MAIREHGLGAAIRLNKLSLHLAIPAIALFAVGLVGLAVYVPYAIKSTVTGTTVDAATDTVSRYKALRAYYTQNVLQKVLTGSALAASVEHEGHAARIPLPATMIHDLNELARDDGTTVELYSPFPFPNRASRTLDSFQQAAWEHLTSDPEGVFVREERRGAATIMRVAVADSMSSQTCLSCHNTRADTPKADWNVGDVRGVLEVSTDISSAVSAARSTAWQLVALALGFAILALGVMAWVYRHYVGQRLAHLRDALDEISVGGGDLTARLPVNGADELAGIATSFNRTMDTLGDMVGGLTRTVHGLEDAVSSSTSIADRMSESVARQQAATEGAAAAVTEVSASAASVAENSADARDAAQTVRGEVAHGQSKVDETVACIRSLASDAQKAAGQLEELERESESIGAVLDVIRGIAEQTNLLALNAAIEAARAGEQGRGFAVVADEVRTLASRTQDSTQEIHDMIQRLQQRSRDAVTTMRDSNSHVQSTVELAMHAGEALESITASVERITELNLGIAHAAEEQSSAASELANSMSTISDGAASSVESAGELRDTARNVSSLTAALGVAAQRFVVDGAGGR